MNKSELISAVAERAGITKKDAGIAVNATLDSIAAALTSGAKVQIPGFGTFEVRTRAARKGLHPHTKEPMEIPESKSVAFKAGKSIKDSL